MAGTASTLLREWDLLQEEVIPPLLEVNRSRSPRVWSLGEAADAVAVTVAFNHALGREPSNECLRVYASDVNQGERVSFALADVKCVPDTSRSTCFSRKNQRWVPGPEIAETVLLSEPNEPVDLVTVRGDLARYAGLTEDVLTRLRDGGQLLLPERPSNCRAPRGFQRVSRDGRVLRKASGSSCGVRRDDRASRTDREATGNAAPTLAGQQLGRDLVESHLRLARALAHRFTHHGEATEDLEQVAFLALVKAAQRYDTSRENSFATYATASILGELKRHFRDKTWMLRVPRSLQETYLRVKEARSELTQQLGASPTIPQIAQHLGVSEDAVLDAMDAGYNYWPASLDVATEGDPVTDIPVTDAGFERSLDRERLRRLMPALDQREQLILKRIYFDSRTQRHVAEEIGVSQMQVSRLLARTLEKLRAQMND